MTFREQYGPWALVTGASEGTGSAFARRIAAEGVHCVLVARRSGPLEALADELREKYGIECVTGSIDLAADDAAQRLADLTAGREIGLVVNNAGADAVGSSFLKADIADWDALVKRNVLTAMRTCHHFGSAMVERKRGGIILVGSGACYGGIAGIAVYCGSKAFDLCFGEGLWAELKPHGVEVLNLILGQTDTPAYREILARNNMPVPDNLASPDEVARVGLERLPHGPVHNWGQADEEAGYAGLSAAARRQRIVAIGSRNSPGSAEDAA